MTVTSYVRSHDSVAYTVMSYTEAEEINPTAAFNWDELTRFDITHLWYFIDIMDSYSYGMPICGFFKKCTANKSINKGTKSTAGPPSCGVLVLEKMRNML